MDISGKEISAKKKETIKNEIAELVESGHRAPCLVAILVGDDPASKVYISNKEKACNEVGIRNITDRYPADITEDVLIAHIHRYNTDSEVDGILVQLPLPNHINTENVLRAIDSKKDVDGFHPDNVSKLWLKEDCLLPCTPKGIITLLDEYNIDLCGKHVVVVGRSNIVGLPISKLCIDRNATVTICHSKTQNLSDITKQADILIVAIGRPKFITGDMVSDGVVVIDVGINRVDGKLYGDVDYEAVKDKASYITPVPGGVGPMTICELMDNTLKCYKNN